MVHICKIPIHSNKRKHIYSLKNIYIQIEIKFEQIIKKKKNKDEEKTTRMSELIWFFFLTKGDGK